MRVTNPQLRQVHELQRRLDRLVPVKSTKQRKAMARRYRHRPYLGTASGKTVYLPRRIFNALMVHLRQCERQEHLPYVYGYEEIAKILRRPK